MDRFPNRGGVEFVYAQQYPSPPLPPSFLPLPENIKRTPNPSSRFLAASTPLRLPLSLSFLFAFPVLPPEANISEETLNEAQTIHVRT